MMKNKIQHYAWGTSGENAFIPKLLNLESKSNLPFAELWMGAHEKSSSEIKLNSGYHSLHALIQEFPLEILGNRVADKFSADLPFLFKVLSAAESLSIQAHPDKFQAEILHHSDPDHYPDFNHKPEIAIALDSLDALAGFKSFQEVVEIIEGIVEIKNFIGDKVIAYIKRIINPSHAKQMQLIRLIYSTLMEKAMTYETDLSGAIDSLAKRLQGSAYQLSEQEKLFLDLRKKYTGADVGLFSLFLFNLFHLQPGQGLFLKAGMPHAYIRGNIVECMANSDNVVRAGLTEKFKDIRTLTDILTYEIDPVPIMHGDMNVEKFVYQVPVDEFRVVRYRFKSGREMRIEERNGPEIIFLINGEMVFSWDQNNEKGALTATKGQSVFIPAVLDHYSMSIQKEAMVFRVDVPL